MNKPTQVVRTTFLQRSFDVVIAFEQHRFNLTTE